ncbi:phage terminase small subunit [Bacillus sp. AFS075034]|uniref:phage terminase small subunit n=1 Tax=Bacillus sp. AFS075034 TaxID=2034281 RepID=UPI000BF3C8E5|nr:phage terminase small subunit [Bacillus sp. AFS075034]PFW61536.1 terminase [Bacillus sp. AFS075034]
MAKARSPNRDKAFEIYKEHNGDIKNRKIAEILQEQEKTISSWKSRDKWAAKLSGSDCSTAMENECSTTKNKRSTSKKLSTALKGNQNAVGNSGNKNPKWGNKNAVGHGAPKGNDNAVTHGLFRKYLPKEIYELKEELKEGIGNDYLSILWENILLQNAQILHSQNIMFVRDKSDKTKEIKKDMDVGIEYEIQYAWDKQANLLNAQSRAMSTLSSLIKQFDELANKDDKRRLELEQMKLGIEETKAKIEKITGNGNDGPIEIIVKRKGEE